MHACAVFFVERMAKELIFCQKLKFSNHHIFPTWFNLANVIHGLKNLRVKTRRCSEIENRNLEFVAKTQSLSL